MAKTLKKILNCINGYCERNPIKTLVLTSSLALSMCLHLLLEEIKTENKYNKACKILVNLADIDKDGILSLDEQVELSRRMGYKISVIEGKDISEELFGYHDMFDRTFINIPRINYAIKSYKGEN